MMRESSTSRAAEIVRNPRTWLLVALFAIITLFQYAESLNLPGFIAHVNENLGLTRYSLERILYLLPIIWAAALFGWRGGAIIAVVAVACMLPRGILISPHPEDAIVETIAVFIVGSAVSFSLEALQKERKRLAQLEIAQQKLQYQLGVIEVNEKRLAALNQTSAIISQSLELEQVLDSAITSVIDVMRVEAVRIYVLHEDERILHLAAHRGVSEEFVDGVRTVGIGEGFNGRVAETGQPLFVEDASEDPTLTKGVVIQENIRSQIIVPMLAKGKVLGTIAVAMHSHREFLPAEVDLLTAIANQIGVAVDNARLYEQLRASEQQYRSLFENAHDAIWLHDLEDNIVGANAACVRLTGYDLDELLKLRSIGLMAADSTDTARRIETALLHNRASGSRGEVKLIRKDGSEAYVELASSLVYGDGNPVAVQYIARDVTEEKRMQENLRFLVQQISRAQEEERKRIALELHDDTVQSMVLLTRQIDRVGSRLNGMSKGDIGTALEELHEEANTIMQGIHRLSQDLRPASLDRLGLLAAVEWLASRTAERSGMDVQVKFVGEERRLPDEVELVLFRITQEALRNAWKHAEAKTAEVTLEFEEKKTRITVKDNGKGFELPDSLADLPRYGRLGLAGMQERARLLGGTLNIVSAPGQGTIVTAELPL